MNMNLQYILKYDKYIKKIKKLQIGGEYGIYYLDNSQFHSVKHIQWNKSYFINIIPKIKELEEQILPFNYIMGPYQIFHHIYIILKREKFNIGSIYLVLRLDNYVQKLILDVFVTTKQHYSFGSEVNIENIQNEIFLIMSDSKLLESMKILEYNTSMQFIIPKIAIKDTIDINNYIYQPPEHYVMIEKLRKLGSKLFETNKYKNKQYIILASSISLLSQDKFYSNDGVFHAEQLMIKNNLHLIDNFRTIDTIYIIRILNNSSIAHVIPCQKCTDILIENKISYVICGHYETYRIIQIFPNKKTYKTEGEIYLSTLTRKEIDKEWDKLLHEENERQMFYLDT